MKCRKKYSSSLLTEPRYLSEISETVRTYNKWAEDQLAIAHNRLYCIRNAIQELDPDEDQLSVSLLEKKYKELKRDVDGHNVELVNAWPDKKRAIEAPVYTYKVRNKEIKG